MKKVHSLTIMVVFFLNACTFSGEMRVGTPQNPIDITPTKNYSVNLPTQSTLTPYPTDNALPTIHVSSTPTDLLYPLCLNLIEKPVSSLSINFRLSVSRIDKEGKIRSSLFDVSEQSYTDIPTDGYSSTGLSNSIAVSPKGTALAILEFLPGNDNQKRLSIISEGKQRLIRPWKAEWARISRWLDEEHLVLLGSEEPITPVFVYNPFIDQVVRYDFRYDDLFPVPLSDWEGQSITSINPTKTAVAYLRATVDSLEVAMKDISTGDILAEITPVISTNAPVWSFTGEWFLIANATEFSMTTDDPSGKEEFFRVGREGKKQITDLNSQYPNARIVHYQMSSDEEHVGFWLYPDTKQDRERAHLAIVDLESGKVNELCIQSTSPTQGPIWIPGEDQFVVKVGTERENNQVILVDLADQSYTIIGENISEIFGWVKHK